jgi:beta-glucosidase/6-phospho-beta-glucosidase/beta-galactosidase
MGDERKKTSDAIETAFLKGTAISTWQCSPDPDESQWTKWAKSRWPFNWLGFKKVKDDISKTPDFWNRYKEDIVNAHKLGCNSFRFSLEWARIEPKRGHIDMDAVHRFNEIFDYLAQLSMEPSVSIHHFVHPAWFEDLGGWANDDSVEIFADFAARAFKLFGTKSKLWSTFNEPTALAVGGFVAGNFPPGRRFRFVTCGRVLLNVLKAHSAAYKAIKSLPHGPEIHLGLTHAMWKFRTAGDGILYWPAKWACSWATYNMGWDVVHTWAATGYFEWQIPFWGAVIKYQHPGGRPPCDWFGIQYYSRPMVNPLFSPVAPQGEHMSLMPYSSDAEGLYECIVKCSQLDVPIYVSETGFPTFNQDHFFDVLDRYVKQVLRAMKEGIDCRGFYIWTLIDNFEWAEGYTKPFGLYAWRPDGSVDRQLKDGARAIIKYNKVLPDNLQGVRAMVAKTDFSVKPSFADVVAQAAQSDSKAIRPAVA